MSNITNSIIRFLKDPLPHFLVAGLVLFVIYRALNPVADIDDPKTVIVDRDTLLTFIQYRTKMFDPKRAAARLDGLDNKARKRLIDDYVREEILFREAKTLGMDKADYIIRRRMVQKVDFLTKGFAEQMTKLDEAQLKAYYQAHKKNYYVQPNITFTHVYFAGGKRLLAALKRLAIIKLAQLNGTKVLFSDAPKHGERFPFHVNYVERTPDYIASHFGPQMAKALFAAEPKDGVWLGPYRSQYGLHLVMVVKRVKGRTPPLKEVHGRVAQDFLRIEQRKRQEQVIKKIIEGYNVKITLDKK